MADEKTEFEFGTFTHISMSVPVACVFEYSKATGGVDAVGCDKTMYWWWKPGSDQTVGTIMIQKDLDETGFEAWLIKRFPTIIELTPVPPTKFGYLALRVDSISV